MLHDAGAGAHSRPPGSYGTADGRIEAGTGRGEDLKTGGIWSTRRVELDAELVEAADTRLAQEFGVYRLQPRTLLRGLTGKDE